MATLDGIPAKGVLHLLRIGQSGREGGQVEVDHKGAARLAQKFFRGAHVVYEGEIIEGGDRYNGRVVVAMFRFDELPGGGTLITIKGSGTPERLN